jgi:hypothetical protein
MQSRILVAQLVSLGQNLWFLLNPQDADVHVYFNGIREFTELLTACDLPHTRQAANILANIHTIRGTQAIDQTELPYFQALMETIRDTLFAEAGQTQLIAVKSGAVSQLLRALPTVRAINDTQQRLLEETILCLEAGANRAAVVMGWNLAYDVIRQWAFDNHLSAFNAALAKHVDHKSGNPVYKPITHYDDFFSGKPGEHTVIDTCFEAQIGIGGKLRDNLQQHLRKRNDYAHRSFTTPTSEQAMAYVQEIVDIITCKLFV